MNKEKRRKKIATIVLILSSIAVAISLFFIIKTVWEYWSASKANTEAVESITTDDNTFKYDHEAALKINPDAKGLYVNYATNSKLPIVQKLNDNYYYLHRDFYQNYSRAGSLFIDGNITEGLDAPHVIIYGHHMGDGSMFSDNDKYKDEEFYKKDNSFYIYTPDSLREYKIFAVYNTSPRGEAYKIGQTQTTIKDFAAKWKANSIYDTGVDVSNAMQVVTLSSCEARDYSKRLVVQGVLTKETPTN